MRWKPKFYADGERRTVTRFLFTPKTLPVGDNLRAYLETRWLEKCRIEQRYSPWGWEDQFFLD